MYVDPKRLLEEEVDSVDSPAAGSGGGGERRKLSLDLKQKTKKTEKSDLEWILFDVNFGIPLFDADLNRKVTKMQNELHGGPTLFIQL